jgi:hypothetical protein
LSSLEGPGGFSAPDNSFPRMTPKHTDRSDAYPTIKNQAGFWLMVTALDRGDHTKVYPRSSAQLSAFIRGKSNPPMTPMKS